MGGFRLLESRGWCVGAPLGLVMLRATQFMVYGGLNFGQAGYRAKKNDDQLADLSMTGKTVMVTGGNAGIGFEVCKTMALAQNANVIMIARNQERGQAAVAEIGSDKVELRLCDVSRQDSVAELVAGVETPLDVLVLNAGVLGPDEREEVDGVERTLATNIVSNTQLIEGLLPALRRSADPRVIFVASGGGLTEKLCTTEAAYEEGSFSGMTAYARTKRMQMAMAHRFQRQVPEVGFYAMHPGWAETEGVKRSIPGFYNMMKSRFRSVAEGADTIIWLASSPGLQRERDGGKLYGDRAEELLHFTGGGTHYSEVDEEACYGWLAGKLKSRS